MASEFLPLQGFQHTIERLSTRPIIRDNGVIISAMVSQISSITIVYSTVYSRRRSKEISKLKALRHWPLWGEIHRWPVNFPHKGPVTRKKFPFDDVIMHACIVSTCILGCVCDWIGNTTKFYGNFCIDIQCCWNVIRPSIIRNRSLCVNLLTCMVLGSYPF